MNINNLNKKVYVCGEIHTVCTCIHKVNFNFTYKNIKLYNKAYIKKIKNHFFSFECTRDLYFFHLEIVFSTIIQCCQFYLTQNAPIVYRFRCVKKINNTKSDRDIN